MATASLCGIINVDVVESSTDLEPEIPEEVSAHQRSMGTCPSGTKESTTRTDGVGKTESKTVQTTMSFRRWWRRQSEVLVPGTMVKAMKVGQGVRKRQRSPLKPSA